MATPVQVKSKVKSAKFKVKVTGDIIVDISLLEDVKVGDWLLVHRELAVNKISDKEAKNIFGLIKKCSHTHEH